MEEFKEIRIKLKDDDKKFSQDFTVYDPVQASWEDPIIQNCLKQAMESFSSNPTDKEYIIRGKQ